MILALDFPELVYKAAGGKTLPAGKWIASAVHDVFRMQKEIETPTTFRQWDKRLATALEEPLLNLLIREAKKAAKGVDYDAESVSADLLALARSRAVATAASVNQTTLERLEGESNPFAASRAAEIGLTEANWATHAAESVILKGKTWTWHAEPNACKRCKKLNGKRRRVGAAFDNEGTKHPGLHPLCKCRCIVD